MDKSKTNLTIILFLMIITGFIIYFMYLKPENFVCPDPSDPTCTTIPNTNIPITTKPNTTIPNTTIPNTTRSANTVIPTCQNITSTVPVAIISRYFGVGFNVYPVTENTSNVTPNQIFLIEHIPITSTGTSGGMYSISSDGTFTIKIKNINDPTQWWYMIELKDPIDNSLYEIMQSYSNTTMALQYANGSLSIRPYTAPGFEGQKFIKSNTLVSRGIPVLNFSPGSMFTTEFDPYSTNSSISTSNLSDSNNKQVTDVIGAVKSGIQQYLSQMSSSQSSNQVTSSSLGNKDMPLNVNFNLGSPSNGISNFANVTGTTSDTDILSILDKYESKSQSNPNSQVLYSQNDLQNQLDTTSNGCKLLNINDYTSNRVSTCNCKL